MSFIQNFFTSRDNNANAETYVGQSGRLWYSPDDNTIYVSDGSTAGGIPVTVGGGGNATFNVVTANVINAGAEVINGNIVVAISANIGNLRLNDQTISGINSNQNIDISPQGSGTLRTLNGIGVYQGNYSSTPLFSVSTTGVVSTIVPNAISYLGAFEVVGNPAGDTVAPQNYGVMIHTTGVPDTPSRYYNDGVAAYGAIINRRYNGTSAAPTPVLDNQIVGRIGATPFVDDSGTGMWPTISTTRMDFATTEDQTTTGQGSKIQFYTIANGETDPTLTLELDIDTGIKMHGDIIPSLNSAFELGNATNKWSNLWLGPDSLFMEDTVLGTDAQITVTNGALVINGTSLIQVGNMQMTTTGISYLAADSGANLIVGAGTNTGYMQVDMVGVKFKDATLQTTAGIPLTQRGTANGVATLDGSGKVPTSQLPAGAVVYKGTWSAATNTPTLANGTGSAGDEYSVSAAGTVDFGAGPITFAEGDFVIYSGTVWQKIPTAIGVSSFNTRTGAVTLTSGDVTNALSTGSIVNSKLANPAWSLTTGQGIGLTGSGTVALGNSITLTNTGVIAAIAGTGVAVSAATGNVTFSIGQAVGTANSVTFQAVTSNTTVAATGNVTGGNLTTAGRVVATGNIVTSANVVTTGTVINSSVSTTGNVVGANLATAGLVTATGNITGGNVLTGGLISATGNITGGNVSATNYTGLVTHSIRNAGVVTGTTLTLNVTTDNIVKCTFTDAFTVAFSNIIAGRVITLIATNTSAGDTDIITAGISSVNMQGDSTLTVTQQTTAVITYYSLDGDTANIYASAVYA